MDAPQVGPGTVAVAASLVVGLVVFLVLWCCGVLSNLSEPASSRTPSGGRADGAARPVVGQIKPPKPEELEQQQARCSDVRERCLPAAKALALHAGLAASEERTDILQEALAVLHSVVAENEADGSLGVVASTELCNALLAADALNALEGLRADADATVAAHSEVVFQHVVPRIWSF